LVQAVKFLAFFLVASPAGISFDEGRSWATPPMEVNPIHPRRAN